MEQRFYKVRLTTGRVIGPLDLERIKLFIYKSKITGLEMARLYPTGDWKDINSYPEIADLLMQKLEGKLVVDERALEAVAGVPQGESDGHTRATSDEGLTIEQPPAPPQVPQMENTGTPQLQVPEGSLEMGGATKSSAGTKPAAGTESGADHEATVIMTADDERTMMVSSPSAHAPAAAPGGGADVPVETGESSASVEVVVADTGEEMVDLPPNANVATEKTAMLTMPPKGGAGGQKFGGFFDSKKKMIIVSTLIVVFVLIFTWGDDDKKPVSDFRLPKIELPAPKAKQDPAKSEAIFKKALPIYYQDTVEGYTKAAGLFREAASWDSNNVRALCLLASSYMNLIDVVDRNETYFNVITKIIELERAKGIDLAETVIADVELYHILGNPDAAFNRIVEFAKTHEWGMDMVYYLALSFYLKGQYAEALTQLNKIDANNFFSPKISYLYGLIFEKNGQPDDAIKAYLVTIQKSPKHLKARIRLAGLYFSKDNLPESGKHADFVITHAKMASRSELSKAYYYRARMHLVANREADALADFEKARQYNPEDSDILLDYYTLKAKQGAKVKDASGLAKMFYFMAEGEKALKENRIDDALAQFLSAREANDRDPMPLIRIADVFVLKGDMQSAITNMAKACALAPAKKEIYPKYVRALIQGYEFEDAQKIMKQFQEKGSPDPELLDRLYGELFLKQEKYQEANIYLKRAMNASNFDSSIYTAYGQLMFKTSNFRDAAFYYGLAQRFDPFNVEATVGIGKALSELETLEKGVEYVQTNLQMSPHKAALLNGIAEIYLRKGDYASSLKYADNALTTEPTFALAHKTKALAYAAQSKRKEAIDEFTSYCNLAPLDPSGHIEMHKIYLTKDEKGRTDIVMAKSELLKVKQQYPKYPGISFMLGDLYYQAGELDKASFFADEEIKANPSYMPAYILSSTVLNKAKDYQHAFEKCSMVLKAAPNYAPALLQCGIANAGLKAYDAARSMMERALALDQGNPQIWKEIGGLYYNLEAYDKMKAAYRKYLEIYPDAPDKTEVEEYLKKVGG